MGWGYCGVNPTTGEEMGYCVQGECHADGCVNLIDHGLGNVCGGEHEGGEHGCGYYFCTDHLYLSDTPSGTGWLCRQCRDKAERG